MDQDQKVRLGGLFFVVWGGVMAWLSIWTPYRDAMAHSPTVSLNRTGIALAILLPLMGVALAIGGETFVEHFKANASGDTKTMRGKVYIAVIAAIALAAYWAVERQFEAMGYSIS